MKYTNLIWIITINNIDKINYLKRAPWYEANAQKSSKLKEDKKAWKITEQKAIEQSRRKRPSNLPIKFVRTDAESKSGELLRNICCW